MPQWPPKVQRLVRRAVEAHQRGDAAPAIERMRKAAKLLPGDPDIGFNLGKVLADFGRLDEALGVYERVVARHPRQLNARLGAGSLLLRLGRPADARVHLEEALRLSPGDPKVLNNLGLVRLDEGDPDGAAQLFRQALRGAPGGFLEAHNNLASALLEGGRTTAAQEAIDQALRHAPGQPDLLVTRAKVLEALDRPEEALTSLDEALAVRPGHLAAQVQRGVVLNTGHRFSEAAEQLDAALATLAGAGGVAAVDELLGEESREARLTAASYLCDWDRVEALVPKVEADIRRRIERGEAQRISPGALMMVPLDSGVRIAATYARVAELARAAEPERTAHSAGPRERLRIGYLSPDFSGHAVGFLIDRLFEHHDRERFEARGYALRPIGDEQGRVIAGTLDAMVELAGQDASAQASRIRDDGVDVLVDLGGFTAGASPGLLARRPAPVQMHMAGYPGTLGRELVDYFVSVSSWFGPSGEFYEDGAEAPLCLPETSWARAGFEMPATRPDRAALGLPEDAVVLACFNGAYRIDREVFGAWMEILDRAEDAVLWLMIGDPDTRARLLAAAGPRADRILFAPHARISSEWLHRAADLWVDTFRLSSGTAGALCAWAGLPVLLRAGGQPCERTGGSVARTMGAESLICADTRSYVEEAVRLVRRPEELAAWRTRLLAARADSPLFRPARFVRHLERGYGLAWERFSAGLPPVRIDVPALPGDTLPNATSGGGADDEANHGAVPGQGGSGG